MSDSDPSVPYGYCQCGCGGKTNVVRGKPNRLLLGHRPGRAKYYLQPDGSKICTRCGERKHRDDFTVETKTLDGLNRMCRPCKRKSIEPTRDIRYAKHREYSRRTREARRANERARRYGLTPERYAQLVAESGGRCAACGGGPGARSLHIDHCHETGQIRGLLCHGCNVSLGMVNDDPERLRALLNYISAAEKT